MKIAKFGGTSVGSKEAIARIISIVSARKQNVIVVSALSGVTDELVLIAAKAIAKDKTWITTFENLGDRHRQILASLAKENILQDATTQLENIIMSLLEIYKGLIALGELSLQAKDLVMSFGEQLSALLVAAGLRQGGIHAVAQDARRFIFAEGTWGNGRPLLDRTKKALLTVDICKDNTTPVVTGFIASTLKGHTITLGRGGSDFTASIIGVALQADEIEIWTDVDGIMSADPRKVPDAFSLDSLSYEEALELSHFGAKVIFPPTIQPALDCKIPIRILNTFNTSFKGTCICDYANPSRYPVRGISSIPHTSLARLQGSGLVGVSGTAMRLFGCLAKRNINIILISQASSERSICFCISPQDENEAKTAIDEEFAYEISLGLISGIIFESNKAIIAIVGERMKHTPGISGRIFHAMGRNGVNVFAIAQGSSELNISAVVEKKSEAKALNAIHEAFFLTGTRSVNVLLVGCGLVGGTLISQIRKHRTVLSENHAIRLNIVGIANSKKMILDEAGLDLEHWNAIITEKGEPTDLQIFLQKASDFALPNSVFVDCTASTQVPLLYKKILTSNIAIVTPNKKGNSSDYSTYQQLMNASFDTGTPYLYETTVGAGLPVLSTLHDLLVSGDKIICIEAMVSGTIGYVMSNYNGKVSFAQLLRKAKALGYTEPDPRDDLCAADVARKALILARECGNAVEFKEVQIEPILPESCLNAPDVESFFTILEAEEPYFLSMLKKAEGKP